MNTQSALTLTPFELFIDGAFVPALDGGTFVSENPATGAAWAKVADAGPLDVDRAVAAARSALKGEWGRMTPTDRGTLMFRLADLVAREAEAFAEIETRDNGKLYREMLGQWRRLPGWLRFFAGAADKLHGDAIQPERSDFFVYTRHEPVGVVAAIAPWNSPALLMMFKLAPALAAGCSFIIKPSEYTPASALKFGELINEAGFPPGVFNAIASAGPEAGKSLVKHPGVDKVTFTGSTEIGKMITRSAADTLKRVSLELGGKSPNIVFEDADIEAVCNGILGGIFAATGQTCMAGSRLFLHDNIHDEVVARVAARADSLRLGDPMDPQTEMGPVATAPQFDKCMGYIEGALAEGAELAAGGARDPERGGLFLRPTVLTGVTNTMRIAREEIFGPVLSVIRFTDEEDVIAQANDTDFGLAGAVWTRDIRRAHRVAHQIEAGTVWINAYRVVSPAVPFGGYKQSGWGRENSIEAIREFTETKAIWVELSGATRDPLVPPA